MSWANELSTPVHYETMTGDDVMHTLFFKWAVCHFRNCDLQKFCNRQKPLSCDKNTNIIVMSELNLVSRKVCCEMSWYYVLYYNCKMFKYSCHSISWPAPALPFRTTRLENYFTQVFFFIFKLQPATFLPISSARIHKKLIRGYIVNLLRKPFIRLLLSTQPACVHTP